jgi:hypothetical protein
MLIVFNACALFKAEMCAAQYVRPAKEPPPEEESGPLDAFGFIKLKA